MLPLSSVHCYQIIVFFCIVFFFSSFLSKLRVDLCFLIIVQNLLSFLPKFPPIFWRPQSPEFIKTKIITSEENFSKFSEIYFVCVCVFNVFFFSLSKTESHVFLWAFISSYTLKDLTEIIGHRTTNYTTRRACLELLSN